MSPRVSSLLLEDIWPLFSIAMGTSSAHIIPSVSTLGGDRHQYCLNTRSAPLLIWSIITYNYAISLIRLNSKHLSKSAARMLFMALLYPAGRPLARRLHARFTAARSCAAEALSDCATL